MAIDYLNKNGLSYFWSKLKAYFAPKAHTHTSYDVKHFYTTAANAAKNWYRIANANTSQLDTTKPIRSQFIVTAYNASYDASYYETWFVNAIVFGRQAHIVIFGGSSAPFSQARILYENTTANIDANDRPAIDLYLNYQLANGTTKVEIEEIYNSGWTFVADGQLTASTVPSGFESVNSTIRNNGIDRSTTADYASYLNRQISNITAAFTLADSYLYRSRTLNCTGTFTITIPSINSGYMWCVIKNKNTSSGVITLHPSTTSVLIDGRNEDIVLQPEEYVCIHSAGANNYSIIADGRHYQRCIVSVGNKNNFPYHRIASMPVQTGSYITKAITFLVNKDLRDQGYGICRIVFRTENVSSNQTAWVSVQWLVRTSNISVDCIQVGLNNTSGASYADVFYKSGGVYNNCIFRVLTHTFSSSTPACSYTVINSSKEVDNTTASDPLTSIESYSSIEVAGTTLHNTNFTSIITASDMGVVGTANSCSGNAATASAVAWSGVTSKPTTISGYGITDAKIANGTITLGSSSITPLTSVPSHNQASNTITAMTGYSKPSSTSAIAASDTLNQAIGKLEKAIDDADISNTVHLTGNEFIGGIKEFGNSYNDSTREGETGWESSSLIIRYLNYIKGSGAPSDQKVANLLFMDSTGTNVDWDGRLGIVESYLNPEGANVLRLGAYKNEVINGVSTHDSVLMGVGYDSNGVKFSYGPSTPIDRTNGTDLLTRDWIPKDTRIVHTTGTEEIGGRKNFTGGIAAIEDGPQFIWKSTLITKGGTLSSEFNNWPLFCLDKNNTKIGGIHFRKYTNGDNKFEFICYNPKTASDVEDYASIAVVYSNDSTPIPYATAPSTRSDRSEGTDIVTRNWIPSDTRIVHTSGAETVGGIKTFSSNPVVSNSAPKYSLKHSSYTHTSASSTGDMKMYFVDKNSTGVGSMGFRASSGSINVLELHVVKRNATAYASICLRYDADDQQYFFPQETNSIGNVKLGSGGHRWGQLYTTTSPSIDSDERLKQQIAPVPDEVLDAWGAVSFCQFKFNDSVEDKGDAARLHSGLVAQRIEEAFSDAGLDARAYGLFCWDGWDAEPDGGIEAGDGYSLRYEEALCMEAAYQRRENARLKKRVADLEERLAALELRLGSE